MNSFGYCNSISCAGEIKGCRKCAYCSKYYCSNHAYLIYRTFLVDKQETIVEHDIACERCIVDDKDLQRPPNSKHYDSVSRIANVYMLLYGAMRDGTTTREDIIANYLDQDRLMTKRAI